MTEMSQYQEVIFRTRYARWLEDEQRRENWDETIYRYMNYMCKHLKENMNYEVPDKLYKELVEAIYDLKIMPSMRALMTAGPALERCNVAGYNCAYIPIDDIRAFDEILYILMCGTGVGFSVERNYVERLPIIAEEFEETDTTIIVQDSKAGWAKAFKELVHLLCSGQIPKWDTSRVRPAGARLKTFGGRASGPDPLIDLFNYSVQLFKRAAGRRLDAKEAHNLVCKVASIVVVGGVRRSALLSLSSVTDDRMRFAKSGQWWSVEPELALANNSACYSRRPDIGLFMDEWSALYRSKSGERGIFNRAAAQRKALQFGKRDAEHEFGTNPCSEIILRPNQFCNLTEVVCRADDNEKTLAEKVRLATILGTFQSTLTNFKYLRKIWKRNTEEERLLGVSLTGIMDCKAVQDTGIMEQLRELANVVNADFADKLGINPSTAITCVKPSGTVSQLVDSASGIHPRHSEYYIRTVRGDNKDPLTQFLIDQGVPNEPAIGQEADMTVFSFPQKSPDGAKLRNDLTAIEHLKLWDDVNHEWCEHKPSITVSVHEDEWLQVGAWVYDAFDDISGISFLPYDGGVYQQAPYQEITKDQYVALVEQMPVIDWDDLQRYEAEDNTSGSQELACSAGFCEMVDIQ